MELTADDKQRLTDIFEAHDPEQLAARLFEYYHDADRADRTSRSQMYLHLGMLTGAVMRVLDQRRVRRFPLPPGRSAAAEYVCSACGRSFLEGDPKASEPCGDHAVHPIRRTDREGG